MGPCQSLMTRSSDRVPLCTRCSGAVCPYSLRAGHHLPAFQEDRRLHHFRVFTADGTCASSPCLSSEGGTLSSPGYWVMAALQPP